MRITRRLITLTLALAFLLFCGLSLLLGVTGLRALGLQNLGDLRQAFGPRQAGQATEDLVLPSELPRTLRVEAGMGDLRVRAGGDRVRVRLTKRAERPGQAEAQAAADALKVEVRWADGVLTLRAPRPQDQGRELRRFASGMQDRVDFEIELPQQVAVDLDLVAGEAEVTGLRAAVKVQSRFGDLRLQDLEGPLTAELSAGAIEASGVGADGETLTLQSRFGDLSVSDARGGLDLRTDSGSLSAERVRAGGQAIVLVSRFGDLRLRDAQGGDCRLENQTGEISLDQVTCAGDLSLKAQIGDLNLEAVQARSAEVQQRAGEIRWQGGRLDGGLQVDGGTGEIDLGRVLAARYALSNEAGDITIALPADIGLDLDLRSQAGEVDSDFHPDRASAEDGRLSQTLTGKVGNGGRRLEVATRVGSIHLRRLPAAPAAAATPDAASTRPATATEIATATATTSPRP